MTDVAQKPSLTELTWQSFKIGCLGFGGPAGQISLMHRLYVERLKWIDEERYLHALNYCMLLPGPEAQQLAVYVGWLARGVVGGLISGVLFVLPGAFFILALSWLYVAYTDVPAVAGVFFGVKAAVLAIVAEALVKIGKRALTSSVDGWVAVAAFLALFFVGVPFPIVILLAACFGAFSAWRSREGVDLPAGEPESASPSLRSAMMAAAAWGALWLAPLAAAFIFLGGDHVIARVGVLFSKLALVTFGGAYAVLAYLQQQAVEVQGWLTAAQMIDGLGLAETTPGPLVLVNQYVGFLAGWTSEGRLGLALACAAMASWCTFAPSFLWIFAGAPLAEHLRRNRYAAGALRTITAAVLGVVASLAIWFAIHVVFTQSHSIATPWGHALQAPALASLDPGAAGLALGAGIALIRLHINMVAVIAICASGGLLLK